MFCIGDKIVYPMYGAGIIEGLEQKEIEGKNETYYVVKILTANLKIMVSAEKAELIGIRAVYTVDEVKKIINSIIVNPSDMPENWNQRYKENLDKIRTGKLEMVAEVARNLIMRESEKGLSSAEKKLLSTAKQIIISEISLSQDVEKKMAEEMLSELLFS